MPATPPDPFDAAVERFWRKVGERFSDNPGAAILCTGLAVAAFSVFVGHRDDFGSQLINPIYLFIHSGWPTFIGASIALVGLYLILTSSRAPKI